MQTSVASRRRAVLEDALDSAAQAGVLLQCVAELWVGGVAEDDKRSLHVYHVHPMRCGARGCYMQA